MLLETAKFCKGEICNLLFISYYKIDKIALGENEHAQQFEKITQLNFKNIQIFPSITLLKWSKIIGHLNGIWIIH